MNDLHDSRNLTMLTDFYELTMANGYFKTDLRIPLHILICFSAPYPTAAVM